MSKPRKSWEPDYRFGGLKGDPYMPPPLGTTHRPIIKVPKTRRKK